MKAYWYAMPLVILLGACSVYQGPDALSDFKEGDVQGRIGEENKHHKQTEKAKSERESPRVETQKPQESQEPKPVQKDRIKEELAPLEATLKQLSALVAANTQKVDALDKQLAQQRTPPPAPPKSAQDSPPTPDQETNLWESVNFKQGAQSKAKIKTNHFLMGYGSSNMATAESDENSKENAYFDARRMLAFSIYQKFIWALGRKQLRSDNLKSILLFSIDKAIDSPEIFKERRYLTLPSYDKVIALLIVDAHVLDRIKQLAQLQYTFSAAQRHAIDRLIHDMQNEDILIPLLR
ncbi:hypothetical protein [Helicobacter salomonis]|uniref:hypothetical protein n=1 Tax=Helicobacter salomonis TaxID=56878 RepID=UPI001F4183B8|nr:hypothetical protein [Helicobacter salomonis]